MRTIILYDTMVSLVYDSGEITFLILTEDTIDSPGYVCILC